MVAALLLLAQIASGTAVQTPRAAVTRALPALERSAKSFVKQRSCFSCHHNGLALLTFQLAASRGFVIDRSTRSDVETKTLRQLEKADAFEDAVQAIAVSDPTPNDSLLLMVSAALGRQPDIVTGIYAQRIARWQRGGHWTTSDFRPPHSSSLFTATATAVRAIGLYFPRELRDERERTIAEARRWLTATRPESTEDATFRVLGLVWADAARDAIAGAARDLVMMQRPGGGWAQLAGYPQDAYSTGEAVYALREAGMPASDPTVRRGLAFLLRTQAAGGTWHVRTRMISPARVSPPYFTTGFPYEKDEYLSYAASCWATMALLSAMPETMPAPKRDTPSLGGSTAHAFPEDARTAMWGTPAELASLLDRGLLRPGDTEWGVSLLMMVAPDANKVKLLIARGADVKYRTAAGFDAITVAASYPGNVDAVRALLDAGADAEPPAGVKATRSPLLFASMSGDLDAAALLLARGAKANGQPNPSGDSPISEAITFGHAGVVRALIAAGAKTDLVERTGVNLLHWAAITNRADVIPELARAGADINAIDAAGFTPLMYAATIDFGDTSTLRALLAAGADKTIRNESGATALQQARRLGHTKLAIALQKH